VAAVAIAWLLAQPGVRCAVASARRPEQLPAILAGASLTLSPEDLAALDASAGGETVGTDQTEE
jgi:aryl-alcohol dehydrogenase-like predicted oxidoreductase